MHPGPAQSPVSALPPQSPAERQAAVVELFEVYGEAVLGYCMRLVQNPALAEDVMQRVFLEAFRDFEQFRGQASRRTWLFAVASHRCLDALRHQQRGMLRVAQDEQVVAGFKDPSTGPFEHLDRMQLLAALDSCLALLSAEMRATVLMRFRTELTFEQMALHLGATADALQMRVARAMPVLRQCLESKGWTNE
jgi:RNA polymerase sigma-70 factor (ECF subfamily)